MTRRPATHEADPNGAAVDFKRGNVTMPDLEPHYPEPQPCGSYLCDQDHDGPCWTCGEPWPCTYEVSRRASEES